MTDNFTCAHCGTDVRREYSICTGCQATKVHGPTPDEKAGSVLFGALFGAGLTLMVSLSSLGFRPAFALSLIGAGVGALIGFRLCRASLGDKVRFFR